MNTFLESQNGDEKNQTEENKMIALLDKVGYINDFFEKIIKKVYIFLQK